MAKNTKEPSGFQDVVRAYTRGFKTRDLQRLFDREAVEAYGVLARDTDEDAEPSHPIKRFFYRAKIVFLGLSFKLSPARRALFATALILTLFGVLRLKMRVAPGGFLVDFSPLWFLGAIAILVFLLMLELVDRVRVRDELEVARQLQGDLLPQEVPDLPGYRLVHSYRMANEVGGDYYDFVELPDGRLALPVGDASGHGIAAGLLMAIAKASFKLALDVDPSPERVAALLNRVLERTGTRRAFMSLFYGLLTPEDGALEYVCAGHPFPLHRSADGSLAELGQGSLPLGLSTAFEPRTGEAVLAPGDVLLLFSDGLPEALDRGQNAFGFDRLKELLATGGSPEEIHQRILQAFDRHLAGEPLRDDFSIVILARDS